MHKRLFFSIIALLVAVPAFGQTTFRCESLDGAYKECRAVGEMQPFLVTQLSDTKCVQGQSWGYRDGRIWVDKGCRADFRFTPLGELSRFVLCESTNGNRTRCDADTSSGVRLVRRISDSGCEFGRDWGYDADGVWVNNGCRAEFGVRTASARRPMTTDTIALGTPTVRCESINNGRTRCDADNATAVTLVRQLSENPCVLNRTWGIDADGSIWVNEGCRGEFATSLPAPTMISSAPTTITLSTPAPAAILCESQNNGRTHCRTDTSMGISLLRQVSENECVRDRTWGVDRDGIWVTGGCRAEFTHGLDNRTAVVPVTASARAVAPATAVFVCESIDGKRNHCPIDTSMGVNLLRQISDADCLLNQSWGVDANGIWVSGGCRGEFVTSTPRINLGDIPATNRVLCESIDGKRAVCAADTRMGVAVVRQISDTACKLNSTWGFDANGIWVTAGCRAEFILRR
jgi:hypothetical protein